MAQLDREFSERGKFEALLRGATEWFTGTARIDPLFQAPDPALVQGASFTFEPGARTEWHRHFSARPLSSRLDAAGVQREGRPIEEIRPGDVVWFSPGEKHWHGATPATAMTHIALQQKLDGKVLDWMEQVTDEQYGSSCPFRSYCPAEFLRSGFAAPHH